MKVCSLKHTGRIMIVALRSFSRKSFQTLSLCFAVHGHAGRSHLNTLKTYSGWRPAASDRFIQLHIKKHLSIMNARCHCRTRKKDCSCLTEKFNGKISVTYLILKLQRGLPKECAHCHIMHVMSISGKLCLRMALPLRNFAQFTHKAYALAVIVVINHQSTVKVSKPYTAKTKLLCPLHCILYEIECEHRASQASSLIHPVMGRRHSNLVESTVGRIFTSNGSTISCQPT